MDMRLIRYTTTIVMTKAAIITSMARLPNTLSMTIRSLAVASSDPMLLIMVALSEMFVNI